MIEKQYDIKNYYLPLKTDLPSLHYDIALYCDCILSMHKIPLPKYLKNLSSYMTSYAKQIDEVKPNKFPKGYRIYVIDNRLNVLFIGLDVSGKMADFFSKYAKYCRELEAYCYGDGEIFDAVSIPSMEYNVRIIEAFNRNYGFTPFEELALPSVLIYEDDELVDRLLISQFQASFLIMKFKKRNIINWERRIDDITSYNSF